MYSSSSLKSDPTNQSPTKVFFFKFFFFIRNGNSGVLSIKHSQETIGVNHFFLPLKSFLCGVTLRFQVNLSFSKFITLFEYEMMLSRIFLNIS
jgi:hypothetical protein